MSLFEFFRSSCPFPRGFEDLNRNFDTDQVLPSIPGEIDLKLAHQSDVKLGFLRTTSFNDQNDQNIDNRPPICNLGFLYLFRFLNGELATLWFRSSRKDLSKFYWCDSCKLQVGKHERSTSEYRAVNHPCPIESTQFG